jgi:methyl-accepting chemotaxis protein
VPCWSQDIQQVLFILTCCLIAASFLATAYVARDLARPLEKLRDYALNESTKLHSTDRMPHNLKIREFNQLSEALDGMVERLRDWAEELETAWKEAQAANQLKNEFLANTSHEGMASVTTEKKNWIFYSELTMRQFTYWELSMMFWILPRLKPVSSRWKSSQLTCESY